MSISSRYTPDSAPDCETAFRPAPRNSFPRTLRPVPARGGLRGHDWIRQSDHWLDRLIAWAAPKVGGLLTVAAILAVAWAWLRFA